MRLLVPLALVAIVAVSEALPSFEDKNGSPVNAALLRRRKRSGDRRRTMPPTPSPPPIPPPAPFPPNAPLWAKELRGNLTKYTEEKQKLVPPDAVCKKLKPYDNTCNCWNDKCKHSDDSKHCNSPKNCLIIDALALGTFQFDQLALPTDPKANISIPLGAKLDTWYVPADMKQMYQTAALTDSADFKSFDYVVSAKTPHHYSPVTEYHAHVGTLRNDGNGTLYLGYIFGWAKGVLITPYCRTASAGHCPHPEPPAPAPLAGVMANPNGVVKRGWNDDEVIKIMDSLESFAFKSALLESSGKCFPTLWALQGCKDGKSPSCCSGKCREVPPNPSYAPIRGICE